MGGDPGVAREFRHQVTFLVAGELADFAPVG
jgi:hypothetical protein